MNHAFSYFSAPVLNTRPTKTCGLREIYELIRSEKWVRTTERLRSLQSATQRREYKAYNLDFVTFSGVFSARRTSAMQSYSNLICLDIDHIGSASEVSELQKKLSNDTRLMPLLMFRSPSGDGLKVVIQSASKSTHIATYNSAVQHLQRTYNVQADNTPDIARACFLCHDPHAYWRGEITDNRVQVTDDRVQITDIFSHTDDFLHTELTENTENAVASPADNSIINDFEQSEKSNFIAKGSKTVGSVDFVDSVRENNSVRDKKTSARENDYVRIDNIVCRLEHHQQDVTTPYRKWFRIGLALASNFGEQGRPLYHRISRFHHNYTPTETEQQYTRCLRYTNHTSSLGTLIYLLNSG